MNFILLGKPGAGKGSLATLLKADGYHHLSTGDIFRAEIKSGSELGKLANSYISKGELCPDEVTNEIVYSVLKENPNANYLFDGYPRTVNQAIAFKETLKSLGMKLDACINLKCNSELIIHRLSSRKVCKKCGAIYNTLTQNPKVEGVCDICGGEVYVRDDDKEESVRNRLNIYEEKTRPLIDFYKNENLLVQFRSDEDLNDLYKAIKEYFSKLNSNSSQNL